MYWAVYRGNNWNTTFYLDNIELPSAKTISYDDFNSQMDQEIYFDGELAVYSLSKQKTYYMQFEELNLSNHMYGEADINMAGNIFIIGTWGETRSLYRIMLPEH